MQHLIKRTWGIKYASAFPYWIVIMLLISCQLASFTLKAASLASAQQGIVNALNLSDRTIQINQLLFGLSDNLIVYSSEEDLSGQLSLRVGQKIEYWTTNSGSLPNIHQYVEKIRILTGFNQSYKK